MEPRFNIGDKVLIGKNLLVKRCTATVLMVRDFNYCLEGKSMQTFQYFLRYQISSGEIIGDWYFGNELEKAEVEEQ